ncbi:hypothetical protein ACFQT0_17640 [Hymenobacter humi]|uniref:Uncharacterized protein n=1 Tax=Hymenobacter humi TaxID=1411620 RepID=A0ABW2U7V5_9BACT
MTRATLLHVLDNSSALGPAEVRELEQLAQAFPYCQTAHLLLAKAAHDQGTMLAGQRLRRAATYAADRTLLRRLIEHVEPALVQEVEPEVAPVVEPKQVAPEAVAPIMPAVVDTTAPPAPVLITPELPAAAPEPAILAPEASSVPDEIPAAAEPELKVEPATEPAPVADEAEIPSSPLTEDAPKAAESPILSEADVALLLDVEGVDIPASEPTPEIFPELEALPEPEIEEDLPAQAPAIRPPVEVGEARFEFGLADTPPPAVPTYELPGLVDEWAASAVTRSLGSLEPLPEILSSTSTGAVPATPVFTPAAFTGDEEVGYGFGESSRLGFSMQLLNLLADKAEAAEAASVQIAAAQPAAAPLPPAGAFSSLTRCCLTIGPRTARQRRPCRRRSTLSIISCAASRDSRGRPCCHPPPAPRPT